MATSAPINLSEQLRDVHLPPEVGLWPLAPAWWALLLILCGLSLMLWWWRTRLRNQRRRNRYRVSARHELELAFETWRETGEVATYLAQVNAVLKRCCLALHAELSAGKQGGEWCQLLRELGPSIFSSESELALTVAIYQSAPEVNVEQLHSEACDWIEQHAITNVHSDSAEAKTGESHA